MKFEELLKKLRDDFPDIHYAESEYFYWSPHDRTVNFSTTVGDDTSLWTLLHETAHGTLNHFDFKSDFHLIKLESEAWEKTLYLCNLYGVESPNDEYIQDCIDTYRNWQYRRSLCPTCSSGGVQVTTSSYECVQCYDVWEVTKQRFCRVYRKTKQPV